LHMVRESPEFVRCDTVRPIFEVALEAARTGLG